MRYRLRTALRENLPERVSALIPKGRHDCGNHEWYKAAEHTWRCYHCKGGLTHTVPWSKQEIKARQRLARLMEEEARRHEADLRMLAAED